MHMFSLLALLTYKRSLLCFINSFLSVSFSTEQQCDHAGAEEEEC